MNTFKTLVTEVKTQMDKEVKFFIDHGIDPSTKYSNIPLYDPNTKGLIVLRGAVKTSPYFSNNEQVSPSDKVLIQTVEEHRIPASDENEGNYYVKNYGEKIEITVDEFKDTIYNNERNEETKSYLRLKDLDNDEQIAQANVDYTNAREQQDAHKNYEFNEWVKRYESWFDLDGLDPKSKQLALENLYKAYNQGYALKDLSKLPIIWKVKNKQTFDIYNSKINAIKDEEVKKDIKAKFAKQQKQWFREKLDKVELLQVVVKWWNENQPKTESTLTELSFPQSQKPTVIKDPYEVKNTLKKLGIDPKFITVPIVKEPIYNKQKYKSAEEDPKADPVQKLTVVSFPDSSKLDDKYGLVRVRDSIAGESFNMNISELKDLINKPENQGTELDTVDYRLHGGQQFNTLNRGMGKFVDLPEEVILEMLKTVQEEDEDFEYVDLIEYYNEEKRSGIPNPLLTKALSMYNQGEGTGPYVIRKFNTTDGIKYKGFIPNDEHIHSKPAMGGKDPYKDLVK